MIALYPPCPMCARPLFPHRRPAPLPSLACVHCGRLVYATVAAIAQSKACADLDELGALDGDFGPADVRLFVAVRTDDELDRHEAIRLCAWGVPSIRRELAARRWASRVEQAARGAP